MRYWLRDLLRYWFHQLGRLPGDTYRAVRQFLYGVRDWLLVTGQQLGYFLRFGWVRNLREIWFSLRGWLFETMQSLGWFLRRGWLIKLREVKQTVHGWVMQVEETAITGAENVRGFPEFVRDVLRQAIGMIMFVHNHPGLRRFALGVPALAVVAAIVTCTSLYSQMDRAEFQARYRLDAANAKRGEQWDAARVRYRRLGDETNYPLETVYGIAESLEALGQTDRAEELYDRLSPGDATGFPAAHVRKAKNLLQNKTVRDEDLATAIGHLERAIAAEPTCEDANIMLATINIRFHLWDDARKQLMQVIDKRPELSIFLAQIADYTGRPDQVVRWASIAARVYEARTRTYRDDLKARSYWVQALTLLGAQNPEHYKRATEVAREVLDQTRDPKARDPELLQLASNAFTLWYDSILDKDPDAAAKRISVLKDGLTLDPNYMPLVQRATRAAQILIPETEPIRKLLEHRKDPRLTAGRNLCEAIEAKRRGDDAESRRLLEDAYKLDPEEPQIGNNLAWLLAMGPDPDLPRAETVINAVLKRYPNHAMFRDTRGQILVRIGGRWPEALSELLFAKRFIPANRDTYLALAQTYRAMGLTREAEEHEKKAASLPSD